MSDFRWCPLCHERARSNEAIPGLCPVGRGGLHGDPVPVPQDLFGEVPPAVIKPPVDPERSEAARRLRMGRRDALAAGHARAKQAGDKQEKLMSGWFTAAIEHVVTFGRERGDVGFLTEEAAAYAYANGLPQPQEKRAWGHVSRVMQKEEPGRRLERLRFDTDNYGSPKSVWRIV